MVSPVFFEYLAKLTESPKPPSQGLEEIVLLKKDTIGIFFPVNSSTTKSLEEYSPLKPIYDKLFVPEVTEGYSSSEHTPCFNNME